MRNNPIIREESFKAIPLDFSLLTPHFYTNNNGWMIVSQ